jgi:acyl-CoA reductase-like NAD-dependent aldehyde dehydrogenase
VSAERFYIHSKIYDRFVKDIAAKMKTLRQVASVDPLPAS